MKLRATIFVEGKSDKFFLKQFLKSNFGLEVPDNQIIQVDGKDKLPKFKEWFVQGSDQNLKNLIVFDADKDFETRGQSLIDICDNLQVESEIFLFPNNSSVGNLEVLLEKIINPDKAFIFDCFQDYLQCLQKQSEIKLNLPAQKTKIHAYLDLLFSKTMVEERNYQDSELWNLDHEYLNPLRAFIKNHIS